MNLVIHDLNASEWSAVSEQYEGWEVIADNGRIMPCIGCFSCWLKTPGQCLIKDGYDRMGALIHNADEVVVISRYTYGGFSSFVKNVFDRSIGYILPFFEVYEDEMHHKKRYPEDKPITFIFRNASFTDDEKDRARSYAEAVRKNMRAVIKDIRFEETGNPCEDSEGTVGTRKTDAGCEATDKIILLNGSLRGSQANTLKFLRKLEGNLVGETEIINASSYNSRPDDLVNILLSAKTVILGMPLYVDGIPSHLLRIMEKMETCAAPEGKRIYTLVNMGMYESSQMRNLLGMVKSWCDKCGFEYCGGLAVGCGEMMGMFMAPQSKAKGPAKNVIEGLDALALSVNMSSSIGDIFADAHKFPRCMYMFAANTGWPKAGKLNGLKKKDLYRRL